MNEDQDRTVDVAAVRERAERRDDVDRSAAVMRAIETRATDGRLSLDAVAEWRRECRQEREPAAEAIAEVETRLEALRASVDPADDDDPQAHARFGEYEDRVDRLASELETVAERLAATPQDPTSPVAVYETARELQRCQRTLHEVAHAHHHVAEEVEAFETWLHDPETRIKELGDELRSFEEYLDNTEGLLDLLEPGGRDADRPFDAWLAAYHFQRMTALAFEELRTDLDGLSAWLARREGEYGEEVADLRDRLASLTERHAACSTRLDAALETVDGFAARRAEVAPSLDRFEEALDDAEPPVDWAEIERLLQEQFDELAIEVR